MRSSLCVLLLLLMGGCGRQDRYTIVGPDLQQAAQPADWTRITEVPVPGMFTHGAGALAAWSDQDALLAMGLHRIFRLQDGLFTACRWSAESEVLDLVRTADGTVLGLDEEGRVCRLEGDDWGLVGILPTDAGGFVGMLVDDRDRPVAYGRDGTLWRREAGVWTDRSLPEQPDFSGGWAHPDQGAFLVTRLAQVYRLTDAGAELDGALDYTGNGTTVGITGDGQGRLVVHLGYPRQVWLRDGPSWEIIPDAMDIYHLFWLEGRLYGLNGYPAQILRRDGADWVVHGEYPYAYGASEAESVTVPRGRLVSASGGALILVTGQEVLPVSPPLGYFEDAIRHQGQWHAVTSEGAHLVQQDGGWRLLGLPLAESSPTTPAALAVDDAGQLLLLSRRTIARWTPAAGYTVLEAFSPYLYRAFPQAGGRVVLVGSEGCAVLDAAGFSEWTDLGGSWDIPVGAALDTGGQDWLADPFRIARLSADGLQTEALIQGGQLSGMATVPGRGLLVFGDQRLWERSGESWLDITPVLENVVDIQAVGDDGQGGLLAWDTGSRLLLHHDGHGWTYQQGPGWMYDRRGVKFVTGPDRERWLVLPESGIFLLQEGLLP